MSYILSTSLVLLLSLTAFSQELYVYTEPASNMPARSIGGKAAVTILKDKWDGWVKQRYTPEIMLGLSKKWMVHAAATFSDMYSSNLRWESARAYAKYRFLSLDDVHRHFRMAAFGEVAHSVNDILYEELSINGDQSGVTAGVILTQLWKKLALSSTLGYLQLTGSKPAVMQEAYPRQAFNYSLSAGYLLFPRTYTSYRQTNLNIYTELLGQQSTDKKLHYIDIAPALQLIFNSSLKVNAGYRFQLNSNMRRMAERSWQLSMEYLFLR